MFRKAIRPDGEQQINGIALSDRHRPVHRKKGGATMTPLRILLRTTLVALVLSVPFTAEAKAPPRPTQSQPQAADESTLIEDGHYTNKAGKSVHSPAHTTDGKAPEGATAKCRDGSYSFSQSRRGTCSRHGGVGNWITTLNNHLQ